MATRSAKRLVQIGMMIMLLLAPAVADSPNLGLVPTTRPGLSNFAEVAPGLYRGAQPSALGIQNLIGMGVHTIVDLRAEQNDLHLLGGTGLQYIHLAEVPGVVNLSDIAEFLRIVDDPANQPVFVHCEQGADRTGVMIAAYRVIEQGWAPEQAVEEALRFHFHPWLGFALNSIRTLNPQQIRMLMAQGPPPRVQKIQ